MWIHSTEAVKIDALQKKLQNMKNFDEQMCHNVSLLCETGLKTPKLSLKRLASKGVMLSPRHDKSPDSQIKKLTMEKSSSAPEVVCRMKGSLDKHPVALHRDKSPTPRIRDKSPTPRYKSPGRRNLRDRSPFPTRPPPTPKSPQ